MPDGRFLDFETFGFGIPIHTEADVNGGTESSTKPDYKFEG